MVYVSLVLLEVGPSLSRQDLPGLFAFIAVAILSEMVAVDFHLGQSVKSQTSLAFLPFLGMIVLFSPQLAAAAVTFAVAISQLLLRRNALSRSFLNIAIAALSASASGVVFHMLAGAGIYFLIAFVGAAAAFFGTNLILASVALSEMSNTPFRTMFFQVTGPGGSNFKYDLLASPIAVVPVLLYDTSPVLGVLVIVLPLILINYSYVSKKQVLEANKDLLRALIKAIETRDPYTSGHSERVAQLSKAIAQDMSLSARKIDEIETAALLHDIGKIDPVFEDVLRKPFELSAEERLLIQTHAVRGAELLQDLSSVRTEVVEAVRHHHECYDGKGYPMGLSGSEIPTAARIIMLSDSIDAMLSDRPYRKALSIVKVRHELERCAGSQFDPAIVAVVLRESTLERALQLVASSPTRSVVVSSYALSIADLTIGGS